MAGYDEDEVTMAVAAARRVAPAEAVGFLGAATAGGPPLARTVAAAQGWERVRTADFAGSPNAGMEALLACLDFVDAREEPALLVAADRARGPPDDPAEHGQGAAAVAVLVTPGAALQVEEVAASSRESYGETVRDEAGRPRSLGVGTRAADVLSEVARRLAEGEDGLRVACSEPDGVFARRTLEGTVSSDALVGGVVARTGDTATCSPFLALLEGLQDADEGDRFLLLAYGAGAAAGLRLRAAASVAGLPRPLQILERGGVDLDYGSYAQHRRFLTSRTGHEGSMGAYLPLPDYLDSVPQRYRLEAGRCVECGQVHFPPRLVCLSCGGRAFETEPLSGQGEVHAVTVIARGSAPSEFREQQDLIGAYAVALVRLREGPRIVAQMTDCDPETVEIGTPVEAVLRRIYRQEGVVRYGYKFRLGNLP